MLDLHRHLIMGSIFFVVVFLFVHGVCGDTVDEKISVMEGDYVTLHTGVTQEESDKVTDWRFGPNSVLIARVNKEAKTPTLLYDNTADGKFSGRLLINEKTGDLTITNIKATLSGLYILSIPTKNFKRTFNVTVVFDKTDGVKTIPVMEGESVTLHTNFTEGQKYLIQWIFENGNIVISQIKQASIQLPITVGQLFKKLEVDQETGSLTIRNIRREQCGIYLLQMTSRTHTIHKRFNVTMFDAVKSLSVMKGDSVTLHTDVDVYDKILWMFEHEFSLIAQINRKTSIVYTDNSGKFGDRLKLDNPTGSLTITDIRTEDAGLYYLEIISHRHTIHKSFIVNVCDALRTINVKVGEAFTLDTGIAAIQKYDQLLWKFGDEDTLIAQINKTHLMTPKNDGKFQNVLYHENGSLTIGNVGTEQSGFYHLEISSPRHTLVKRFNVFVIAVTDHHHPGYIALMCVAAVLLFVIAGWIFHCYRNSINAQKTIFSRINIDV